MSKLLSFLIRKEDESQFETSDAEFKGLVFANSPELGLASGDGRRHEADESPLVALIAPVLDVVTQRRTVPRIDPQSVVSAAAASKRAPMEVPNGHFVYGSLLPIVRDELMSTVVA